MPNSKRLICRAVAAALLIGSKGLVAQESGGQQTGGLEEIVVTARFRQENLQEIPLAVSAFTADTLAANGATNILDVARWAPNVTLDPAGQGTGPTVIASVRGLGYGDFKATQDPTVTFYIDDVVLARPTGAIMDLLDLDRVEVLRGPQGTLFGKNAIGGVVRMISRKPGEGDGLANMELTAGSYDRLDVRGSFESTLVENKLFSRVAFVSKTRDGYMNNVDYRCAMIKAGTPQLAGVNDGIVGWNYTTDAAGNRNATTPIMGVVGSREDNDFAVPGRITNIGSNSDCIIGRLGDQDTQAARVMLRYTPSDILEVNFSADITDQDDTSPYELTNRIGPLPANGNTWNNRVALLTYGVPYDNRFAAPDIDTTYAGFNNGRLDGGIETPNTNAVKHWGTSVTFDINLDAIQIKTILAHRDFDSLFGQDSDGSPLPYSSLTNRIEYNQDSFELRVSGELFGGRTTWTAGYFGLESSDLNSQIVSLNPCILNSALPGTNPPQPRPGTVPGEASCQDRVDWVDLDSDAVFINTETDLTERLELAVGVRRSHDVKDTEQARYNREGGLVFGWAGLPVVRADDSSTDPMVSLTYALTDQVRVYGTYQEGFRGGGTNARATPTTRLPFGPEELANREIGVKSDLFGDRLRVNASVFEMVHSDIVQGSAGFDVNGTLATIQTNAATATIQGLEVETQLSIGDHWTVDTSLAHLDYRFTDLGTSSPEYYLSRGLTVPADAIRENDDGPARSPRYTASVNVGYYLDLPSAAEFSLRFGAAWRDEAWWGRDGDVSDPFNRVPPHTLTNFRAAWTSPNDAWEYALFCTNCSDVRTMSSIFNTLSLTGRASVTYIRPREAGLSVKRTF